MENKEKSVFRYLYPIIVLAALFLSIYFFINYITYENRDAKTIILDSDLFQDGFSNSSGSGFQVENVVRLNLPWNIWDLRDLNFINNTSLVFTLDQSLEGGAKLNTMNQLKIYSNEKYHVNELTYNVTTPIVVQDENTLLFSPINRNVTHVFNMETKEITNTLDGIVYKVLPDKKQYILISNGLLVLKDIDSNKKQRLIHLEELEEMLYEDYRKAIESNAKHLLDGRYFNMGLTIELGDYEGQSYDLLLEERMQEHYEAGGRGWRVEESSDEELYFLPFIYLNPWDFQISADESKVYFKVSFGLYSSTIYSLDISTNQISTLLEGNITDFRSIDNDKLIIQENIDYNGRLYIYNIQDQLIEETISTDVLYFDMTPDGKLVYITTNSSGINELRVGHYDGEELKVHNTVYISTEYIGLLKWSLLGEEFFFISDNIGTTEVIRFKIKTN